MFEVTPEEFWEAHKVYDIIRKYRRKLEAVLGLFLVSGKSIYTLNEIDETLEFNFTPYNQSNYKVKIDKDSVTMFNFSEKFNNKDNSLSQNLLNIIIKSALR